MRRRSVLSTASFALVLAACGASPSASGSAAGLASSAPTESSAASPSESPRTLTFQLNPLGDSTARGTVVIDIASGGYTMTVTVDGLDPNTTHIINTHDSSCSSMAVTTEFYHAEVVADATGHAVSVNLLPTAAYLVRADGLIVTVHGTSGTNHELSHIACADLTN